MSETPERVPLLMPQFGTQDPTSAVDSWLKNVGDPIRRGEPIALIETDKALLEMTSPQSGTLVEIVVSAGTEAQVGDVVGFLESDGTT